MESIRVEVDCTAGLTAIYTVPALKTLVVSNLYFKADSFATSWQAPGTFQINAWLVLNGWGNSQWINLCKWLLVRAGETLNVAVLWTWGKAAMLCGELVTQL